MPFYPTSKNLNRLKINNSFWIHKRGKDTEALVNNVTFIKGFIVERVWKMFALHNHRLGSPKWRFLCKVLSGECYQEPHQKGGDKAGLERGRS